MTNEQETVLEILQELTYEVENPPLNPTLTKDDFIWKMHQAIEIIERVEFKEDGEEEDDDSDMIEKSDISDLDDDVDDAHTNLIWMKDELKEDPELKTEEHREKFMTYFRDLDRCIEDAKGELFYLL